MRCLHCRMLGLNDIAVQIYRRFIRGCIQYFVSLRHSGTVAGCELLLLTVLPCIPEGLLPRCPWPNVC